MDLIDQIAEGNNETLNNCIFYINKCVPRCYNRFEKNHTLDKKPEDVLKVNAAIQCFESAEKNDHIVTKSIGKPGRYLHLIYIDHCKAMQSGVQWTDYAVENGLSADTI